MSIHQADGLSRKRVASLGAWLALSGMLLLPGYGKAQLVAMNDAGSTANIDLGSSAGMYGWTVNGQNQLNQQWFWYQANGGSVQSIDKIGTPTVTTYNGPDGINEVNAVYQNSQLSISIDYYLQGGGIGSGNADITESITANNLSGSSLDFNFYQYSNFNLMEESSDNVQIIGSSGAFNAVRQWNGSTAIAEVIAAPDADYAEAGYYSPSGFNPSGPLNGPLTAGPGDVTWAFEWSTTIATGGEFDLTKDKSLSIQVVPEPATLAIIGLGVGALGLALRRKLS